VEAAVTVQTAAAADAVEAAPAAPAAATVEAGGGPRSPWRTGLLLASSVLGVGLLLSPPITAGLAGPRSWLAWSVHLVTGGLFCLGLGLTARLSGSTGGVAGLVAAVWGEPGRRGVDALYLAGFVAGQAAIALAAGQFAAYAVGRADSTGLAFAVALATVAVAAAIAVAVHGVRASLRSWRVGLALLVGLALAADPVLLRGSGLLPVVEARQFWPAVFLLLFAGVGWEQSARLAHGLRDTRELGWAIGFGTVVISGGYLLVGTTASSAGLSGSARWPTVVSTSLASLVALLLASFCLTNIQTAAGFVRVVMPRRPAGHAGRVVVVGTAVLMVLLAGARAGWQPHQLLAGPAVATWLIYVLVLSSGVRTAEVLVLRMLVIPAGLLVYTAAATVWSLVGDVG
jgi:amino acid efflux transporter